MSAVLEFDVYGEPAPQGSKRHVGNGRMVESSAKVKPWREAVKSAARDAIDSEAWVTLNEPVAVHVTFCFRRPASHFGTGRNAGTRKADAPAFPSGKPDIDKLLRSTFDALTDAGVWQDDSRVISVISRKVYLDHDLAGPIGAPGAHIAVGGVS